MASRSIQSRYREHLGRTLDIRHGPNAVEGTTVKDVPSKFREIISEYAMNEGMFFDKLQDKDFQMPKEIIVVFTQINDCTIHLLNVCIHSIDFCEAKNTLRQSLMDSQQYYPGDSGDCHQLKEGLNISNISQKGQDADTQEGERQYKFSRLMTKKHTDNSRIEIYESKLQSKENLNNTPLSPETGCGQNHNKDELANINHF